MPQRRYVSCRGMQGTVHGLTADCMGAEYPRAGASAPAGALDVPLRDHGDAGGHEDGGLIALLDA
jgi:hypothetical protein